MRYFAIAMLALIWAVPAFGQHSHGAQKGPNGGPVEDVVGIHAELVRSGTSVTLNLLDEGNKPVSAKGYTGSALVVLGSDKEAVTLTQAGESALKGEFKKALGTGAAVTVTLKAPDGKSGQVKFKN